MTSNQTSRGEVHCLLCGRCLAEIENTGDGKLRLHRAPRSGELKTSLRIVRGKIHCARCGGRAFVEWDLMPTHRATARDAA